MKNKKEYLMSEHKVLIKMGKFQEAQKLLDFLVSKRIVLGFSDTDNYIENLLEALDFSNSISIIILIRTFYLK